MTRVLVAEDNASDRLLLARIVKREGYEVITAVDGHEALARFIEFSPDVVLLDAMMPGLDGFEVARTVRATSSEDYVPIVFLSSLTGNVWLDRCLNAGGDDFLSKPYNPIILKAKLRALTRLREQQHQLRVQREELHRLQSHLLQEQLAAKSVFDKIAHTGKLKGPFLKHLLSPMSVFNGDVLLAAHDPAGDLLVLLGDFTGHGLTAAIGALPLADIFYGMTAKGFSVSDILRESNRKLRTVLPPGYFCCVTLLRLSLRKNTLEYWNGGLPSAILVRHSKQEVFQLVSRHLPLGILDDQNFVSSTGMVEVEQGDSIILVTDGLVEAESAAGEAFGHEHLTEVIRQAPASRVFETVLTKVQAHMENQARTDDLTLVEVSVLEAVDVVKSGGREPEFVGSPQDWKLCYELGPRSLRAFNPLPVLQHILMESPQLRRRGSEIYTILAETYSNALEHGVMGLDSSLKDSAQGFATYYARRAQALENLDGFIRFELTNEIDDVGGVLTLRVTDSGQGFDFRQAAANSRKKSVGYHGRGMMLLHELCDEVTYEEPGNSVVVRFKWSTESV
jgi:two-component system, HptB-dependent secretion and biofilm response regulator